MVYFLSITEDTEVTVNSIEDDVRDAKDKRTGSLIGRVEISELTMFVNMTNFFAHGEFWMKI